MFKIVPVFKIRVVYKSGYFHDFKATNFKISSTGTGWKYSWEALSDKNKPILLGIDDIAAVYQIGVGKAVCKKKRRIK